MAKQEVTNSVTTKKPILPNTPEMETLLSAGYNMTIEEAKDLVAMREKNPALVSYDEYKKAKAFLAAYTTKSIPVDPEPGYRKDGS